MLLINPKPGSRLEQLLVRHDELKAQAKAAAEAAALCVEGVKAELAAALAKVPGETQVQVQSPDLERPLQMQAKTTWRFDSKAFKAADVETYVRYAKQSTTWELRQVSA